MEQPPAPPRRPLSASGGFIRTMIVIVVVLVVAMTAVIFWHWAIGNEPTTAILVVGDSSLDGAKVVVTGSGTPPVTVILSSENHYRTPIFRLPGQYHVVTTWHDQTLDESDLVLDRYLGKEIDLPTTLTVQGDAALDGTEVAVNDRGVPLASGTLERANDFKWSKLLMTGQYRLTARRAGERLPFVERDVVVLPHSPQTIDLAKKN